MSFLLYYYVQTPARWRSTTLYGSRFYMEGHFPTLNSTQFSSLHPGPGEVEATPGDHPWWEASSRPFCCSLDSTDDHAKMTTAPLDEGWRQLMGQGGSSTRAALPWDPATLESPTGPCGASQLTGSPGWPPGALTGLGLLRKEPCPVFWWLPKERSHLKLPLDQDSQMSAEERLNKISKFNSTLSFPFFLVTFIFILFSLFVFIWSRLNGYK